MHKLGEYVFYIAIAFFIAFVFFISTSLQDLVLSIALFFGEYVTVHPIIGVFIFVALAAVSAFLSPFSSVPLVPIAVLIWGNAFTFVLLFIGWILGDIVAYGIGGYAGKSMMWRLISEEKMDYYRKRIPARAEFPLVVLFRFAAPSEIGGYVLGAMHTRFGKYFFATLLAELPFALMTVYASDALVQQKPVLFSVCVGSILVIVALTVYFFNYYIKKDR